MLETHRLPSGYRKAEQEVRASGEYPRTSAEVCWDSGKRLRSFWSRTRLGASLASMISHSTTVRDHARCGRPFAGDGEQRQSHKTALELE